MDVFQHCEKCRALVRIVSGHRRFAMVHGKEKSKEKSRYDMKIIFHMEPADRSVGIMAEGFAAWLENGEEWCNLEDLGHTFENSKFEWFSNETGDSCTPPGNHKLVEMMLHAYVESYYQMED